MLDSRLVTGEDAYAQLGRSVDEINDAYRLLFNQYVDELKPEDLSKSAISGMLWDLDPYTTLFDRESGSGNFRLNTGQIWWAGHYD